MLKNIDSFYYIGKSHEVCDDFALVHTYSIQNEQYTLAMVADGCSSSKNSSIGARFLLTEIARTFKVFAMFNVDTDYIKYLLESCIKNLLLNTSLVDLYGDYFLDCTLLISLSNSNTTRVFVIGDGTLIWKSKAIDSIGSATFNFDNNMPFYLSYVANKDRLEQYKQQVKNYQWTTQNNHTTSLSMFYKDDWFIQDYTFNHNEVQSLILCTDGISSFQDNEFIVPAQAIAEKLTDIKNDKGVFLQRRAKRIIEEYAKSGIYHQDDFSSVSLLFED